MFCNFATFPFRKCVYQNRAFSNTDDWICLNCPFQCLSSTEQISVFKIDSTTYTLYSVSFCSFHITLPIINSQSQIWSRAHLIAKKNWKSNVSSFSAYHRCNTPFHWFETHHVQVAVLRQWHKRALYRSIYRSIYVRVPAEKNGTKSTELYSKTINTHSFWQIVYLAPLLAVKKFHIRNPQCPFLWDTMSRWEKKCVTVDVILTLMVWMKT